jgi:signal transduction histidine kinase
LVEISKITSGNIELECMPIDFGELVRQSIGEFEDKFAEHGLHIVDNISAEPLMIYADGRRTFRVLDNLMQNIYKYAMPKTRVYIDLLQQENQIRLSIKNISKAELNIDAKELMERFVRGEQSRSTEGSGLGLSIAGDLVRIQNGNFDLVLDGDLFKVIITFPQYYKEIPASIDCDDEARSDENQE